VQLVVFALVFAAVAALPPLAAARPLSADRPESPHSVPAGEIQLEADAASVGFTDEGGERRASDLATLNLKLGLHRAFDLQFVGTAYAHERFEPRGLPAASEGRALPSLAVRLKCNLAGNDGGPLAVGLLPYVEFERGSDADPRLGALVPVALELPAGAERAGADAMALIASVTLARDAAPRLGAFVELFGAWDADGGAVLESTFDSGVTFAAAEFLQLDAGAYHGLGGGAEDVRVFAGLSWRGRPWRR